MQKLKQTLVEMLNVEIEDRGQNPISINIDRVYGLYRKHYPIQQIADIAILEHYRLTPGFNRVSKLLKAFLTHSDEGVRGHIYDCLNLDRLTVKDLQDSSFEQRVQCLTTIVERAIKVFGDEDMAWKWLVSSPRALNYKTALETFRGGHSLRVLDVLGRIDTNTLM